jgi:hypothetical protein
MSSFLTIAWYFLIKFLLVAMVWLGICYSGRIAGYMESILPKTAHHFDIKYTAIQNKDRIYDRRQYFLRQ